MLKCKHCGAKLTAEPIRDHSEWVILCFACGAENIIQQTVEVVGYRANE